MQNQIKSNNNIEQPVIFEGHKFFGICEFDCVYVSLYTEKKLKGTFVTCLPISSYEYRFYHPTKAKVIIEKDNNWTVFKIHSDHGTVSEMKIHNSLHEHIYYAKRKAIEYGLLCIVI